MTCVFIFELFFYQIYEAKTIGTLLNVFYVLQKQKDILCLNILISNI